METLPAEFDDELRAIGLEFLRAFLAAHRVSTRHYPDSSADLHLRLTGHKLAYGCCGDAMAAVELELVEKAVSSRG